MANHRNSGSLKHKIGISATLTVIVISILLSFAALAPNSHRRGPPAESTSTIESHLPPAFPLVVSDSDSHILFARRPLFPFSVVPGGVESARELSNAIVNDPVVAKHYVGFNAGTARVVTLNQDLLAYVSYRIGGDIFWTKKQITLHKNETVINDGNIVARTRCGNRVSETFQLPISTREPSPQALDAPQILETANLSIDSLNLQPLPKLVSSENIILVNPVIPPIIWEPNPPVGPLPPLPPPPIVTPEFGTGVFLILALSAGCLLAKSYGMRHEFRNL
jgi:hypothetical protein